ncbi:MAG: DUF1731 domain-containing protein, partial [Planctomycetes bacterium]|nr:DUF1731 domain-containing protein [Planctomycetota bacterium]
YAHTIEGPANTESEGVIGGEERDVPDYWKESIDIAKAWEAELERANTPKTRKIALRAAMVMSANRGGVFDVLSGLARKGLGGVIGSGRQYVSWCHAEDFARALDFLIEHPELNGVFNVASPNPLPQREFAAIHRKAIGVKVGLPAFAWMVKLGAIFMKTDAELVLKSRKVVPQRLLDAGFEFDYPTWPDAAPALAKEYG